MHLTLFYCVIVISFQNSYSANILGIFHYPCQSHHILGSTLLKALAAKGHQVTMVSSFPFDYKIENYTDIDIPGMLDFKEKFIVPNLLTAHDASMYDKMTFRIKNVKEVAELFLENRNVKALLNSNKQIDLVILNWSMNEALLGIAHYFKAPVIAFSTIGSSQLTNKIVVNPAPYSYTPHLFSEFPNSMDFKQRVENFLWSNVFELIDCYVNEGIQRDLLQKYFPSAPPLEMLIKNVSLVFLNSHFGIESARPYLPNIIEIGGFHVGKPKELTGKLMQFMDEAVNGVVFFSLGTNIKSSHLPSQKLNSFVRAFEKLKPVKVLWKFEKQFNNLPSNVMVNEWLPQSEILAHPNTKAFVTHGGRLSTIEALYFGVPIIGIPFFADQERNIADCVNEDYGIKLDFRGITEELLSNAINEALNNPKYRKNAKLRSNILNDQPLKQLDSAIYWVEYVIRHRGAPHLQSAALNLSWWQYLLLDVITFIAAICLFGTILTCILTKKIFKLLTQQKGKSKRE